MSESAGLVRDFDFHPDEDTVRVFKVDRREVPRLDDEVFVSRSLYGETVLHHYAWADRWFKVNVTTDLVGNRVETAPTPGVPAFAFNIDLATPMRRLGGNVFAVDLFCDLLVRSDARSYVVSGDDEMDSAHTAGLISASERKSARYGLDELIGLVESGGLLELLQEAHVLGPSEPAVARPMERIRVEEHPEVGAGIRWSW